jgi:hypothetical protein
MRENLPGLLYIFVGFRFVGIGFAVEIYCFARLYCFARISARTFKSGCNKFTHVLFGFYFLQVIRDTIQTVFDRIAYFE